MKLWGVLVTILLGQLYAFSGHIRDLRPHVSKLKMISIDDIDRLLRAREGPEEREVYELQLGGYGPPNLSLIHI